MDQWLSPFHPVHVWCSHETSQYALKTRFSAVVSLEEDEENTAMPFRRVWVWGRALSPLLLLIPWSSHQEKQGWGSAAVPGGKKKTTVKNNFKPTWLSSPVPSARVCWFMTTSQSCPQTVWQPRQTEILNSVKCRPVPFHLQHLPCTRTTAPHKSVVPVPGELSPGLLQLVRAVSGDRISTLMLSIDLCLIYIPLIWFSPWRHEYKSKVMPTRVRSYPGFRLV